METKQCRFCGNEIDADAEVCPHCHNLLAEEKTVRASGDEVLFAFCSYLSPLVLIPIIAARQSVFVRFHANQGLVIFIAELIIFALSFIPVAGHYIRLVGGMLCLVLSILGLVNVLAQRIRPLPIVGRLNILK